MGWFTDNVLDKAAAKAFEKIDTNHDGGLCVNEVIGFC